MLSGNKIYNSIIPESNFKKLPIPGDNSNEISFSPDNLASTASSSLVWLILEIGLIYLTLTVMSINTTLTKWDILSFSCYKYVGVITVLLIGGYSTLTYYLALAYVSAALGVFLLRTLRLRIEPEVSRNQL